MSNAEANDGYVKEELRRLVAGYRAKLDKCTYADDYASTCNELIAELEAWAEEYEP